MLQQEDESSTLKDLFDKDRDAQAHQHLFISVLEILDK